MASTEATGTEATTGSTIDLESRIKGAIFGVACADALGGPNSPTNNRAEFHRRGTFPKITEFRRNANFGLPPGCWTDDTSMTLCLAQSLIDVGFSPYDQVTKYIAWWMTGYLSSTSKCLDIGNLTCRTLSFWKDLFDDYHQNRNPNSEEGDSETTTAAIGDLITSGQISLNKSFKRKSFSGNGSLMRTVPIGLYFHNSSHEEIRKYSTIASDLTHPYPANAEACTVYNILVASCLSSSPSSPTKESLFLTLKSYPFTDPDLSTRFSSTSYPALSSFSEKDISQISSSGWVINSLEAALWAFFTSDGFEDGAVRVVNLGDDADTVGAIYGGLAGAFYGVGGIPQRWKDGIVKSDVVEGVAVGLCKVIKERGEVGLDES